MKNPKFYTTGLFILAILGMAATIIPFFQGVSLTIEGAVTIAFNIFLLFLCYRVFKSYNLIAAKWALGLIVGSRLLFVLTVWKMASPFALLTLGVVSLLPIYFSFYAIKACKQLKASRQGNKL
ncbi:MAG: hypothetical protein KDK50_02435 [Chlamydiia bacterium]|nr:hypothetical protein [Chlamydiia bacterium]